MLSLVISSGVLADPAEVTIAGLVIFVCVWFDVSQLSLIVNKLLQISNSNS